MTFEDIRIVLVSPIYGGNVGSACRAMANMGFSDLAIAAPRRLDMNEARMMACHAQHILAGRTEYPTLAEAVADCGAVVGTTARTGMYRQQARTPRDWVGRLLESAHNSKAAIVFGREDDGMTNEELALCTQLVHIPTSDEYTSINLAQAVMILCHEVFVAGGTYELPPEKSPESTSDLRERMFVMWREWLLGVGFMEEAKADHMMYGLRRILARGTLTVDDVRILMGIARQTKWALGAGRADRGEESGPPAAEEEEAS